MIKSDAYTKVIGNFFKQKRLESGRTMDELSKACGHKSKGWYSSIEYGNANVSIKDSIKLCHILGTTLNELQLYVESHLGDYYG